MFAAWVRVSLLRADRTPFFAEERTTSSRLFHGMTSLFICVFTAPTFCAPDRVVFHALGGTTQRKHRTPAVDAVENAEVDEINSAVFSTIALLDTQAIHAEIDVHRNHG